MIFFTFCEWNRTLRYHLVSLFSMTKIKKQSSRFYTEQESLYETSDFSDSLTPAQKRKHKKMLKAQEAEQRSHQKIIAVCAPVDTIIQEESNTSDGDLWDAWIER